MQDYEGRVGRTSAEPLGDEPLKAAEDAAGAASSALIASFAVQTPQRRGNPPISEARPVLDENHEDRSTRSGHRPPDLPRTFWLAARS